MQFSPHYKSMGISKYPHRDAQIRRRLPCMHNPVSFKKLMYRIWARPEWAQNTALDPPLHLFRRPGSGNKRLGRPSSGDGCEEGDAFSSFSSFYINMWR